MNVNIRENNGTKMLALLLCLALVFSSLVFGGYRAYATTGGGSFVIEEGEYKPVTSTNNEITTPTRVTIKSGLATPTKTGSNYAAYVMETYDKSEKTISTYTNQLITGFPNTNNASGALLMIPKGFQYYNGDMYDLYIKITDIYIEPGKTQKWYYNFYDNLTRGNTTGPYMRLNLTDGGSGTADGAFSYNFEAWLIKAGGENTTANRAQINFLGGSCYMAPDKEYCNPWSTDGKIYVSYGQQKTFIKTDKLDYHINETNSGNTATFTGWRRETLKDNGIDKEDVITTGLGTSKDRSIKGGFGARQTGAAAELIFGYNIIDYLWLRLRYEDTPQDKAVQEYITGQAVNMEAVYKEFRDQPKYTGMQLYWTSDKDLYLLDGTKVPAGTKMPTEIIYKLEPVEPDKDRDKECITLTAHYDGDWSYKASGTDTIVATRTDYSEATPTEIETFITVTATNQEYNGQPVPATLTNLADWGQKGLTTPTIIYEKKKDDGTYTTMTNVPTEAGEYKAKIEKGIGGGKVTAEVDYKITKKLVTATVLAQDKVYDGYTTATVIISVTESDLCSPTDKIEFKGVGGNFNSKDVDENKQVTATYTNVTGNRSDSYEIDINLVTNADITPKPVGVTWGNTLFKYDGEEHVPTATVSNIIEGDTCTPTVVGKQVATGTYIATATELTNTNYELKTTPTQVEFTIYDGDWHYNKSDTASNTIIATKTELDGSGKLIVTETHIAVDAKDKVYDGKPAEVTLTNLADWVKNGLTTPTIFYEKDSSSIATPTDVGKYKACIQVGEAKADDDYEITQRPVTVSWSNLLFKYNGEEHVPTATVLPSSLVAGDTCTPTVVGKQVATGTHLATVTTLSNLNYKIGIGTTTNFTIYDGSWHYTVDPENNPNTIVATKTELDGSGKLIVTETHIAVDAPDKVYDGKPLEVTMSNLEDWVKNEQTTPTIIYQKKNEGGTYTTLTDAPKDAGEYTVLIKIDNLNAHDDCKISPKPVGVTWSNLIFKYDKNKHVPTAVVVPEDLVSPDTCTPTVIGEQIVTGTHIATATGLTNKNYELKDDPTQVEFTIYDGSWHYDVIDTDTILATKTDLGKDSGELFVTQTHITVTATDQEYNGNPVLASLTNLEDWVKNGLTTPTIIYEKWDGTTWTDIGSNPPKDAGEYRAKIEVGEEKAYTDMYEIMPKSVEVTWSDLVFEYNGENHIPKATATGLIGDDACEVIKVGTQTNAGNYIATATGLTNPSYTLTQNESTKTNFEITPREAQLQWSETTFVYDGKEHIPVVSITNLVGNDTCGIKKIGAAVEIGTHLATVTSLTNPNYKLHSNTTVEFNILRNDYTIIATATNGGYITPDGVVNVASGQDKKFTAIASDGYTFKKFVVDEDSDFTNSNIYTFENIDANHEIQAVFSRNGWEHLPEDKWMYYRDDVALVGWHDDIKGWEGQWFYFDENGIMQTGWINNLPGWGDKWFYFDRQTGVMKKGWAFVDDGHGDFSNKLWYYFDPQNGFMYTDWQFIDGKWYYLDYYTNHWGGAMVVGWHLLPYNGGEAWFYFNRQDGHMHKNWSFVDDGLGDIKNILWYYLDPQRGNMYTEWKYVNGRWYYLDYSRNNYGGAMQTGWQFIDGYWYFLGNDGAMYEDALTPDGYYVNDKGVWVQ